MGLIFAMVNLPPCSRCGQTPLLTATPPDGVDALLELCQWCDAGSDGAASDLVAMLAAGLPMGSMQRMAELLFVWYRQVTAARGWCQDSTDSGSFAAWESELAAGVPGPLSLEAEQRMLDLYRRLTDEPD